MRQAIGAVTLFARVVAAFRPGLHDDSTEAGRAHGRVRRVLLAMSASSGARLVSMLTGLFAVPITYGYLGDERYGLWSVISSLSLALNFADLGLGNSLVTTLAEAHGRGDEAEARRHVSTAFFLFSGIALVLLAAFWVVYPHVDWWRQFNVKSPAAAAEVGPAVWCFVICLAVGLVGGIVSRIELAYQNGFANGVWQAVGSVATLLALVIAMRFGVGLAGLVLILAGVPNLTTAVQACIVFFITRKGLRPAIASADSAVAKELLRLGAGYVVLQLAMALSMYSDNIVTTQILGPSMVTQLSLVSRPFVMISSTLFMALVPMWPAYTEALTKGDFVWVRSTLNRSLLIVGLLAGVPSLLLILVGSPLIRLWIRNPAFEVPMTLLAALALWTVLQTIGTVCSALMNAMRHVRFQAVCASITAVVAIGAKIFLARRAGNTGLVMGTSLAYLTCTLLPVCLYLRYALARRNERHEALKATSEPS